MKKYRGITVALKLFFLFFCCNAFADICSNSEEHDIVKKLDVRIVDNKFYVEPGTIYISPTQILLNISGEFLPVRNLFSDDGGVFVLAEEILAAKAKDGF